MKHKYYFLIIFLALGLEAFSQTGQGKPGNVPSGEKGIEFSETEYDFGTVITGDEAVHYFVFSNKGTSPLIIVNVRTSCGCMAPAWPKSPIASGSRDSIKVEYNTKIRGVFDKTITVQTNARNSAIDLRIKGNVVKASK
jgi:hypothetical protein